MSDIEIGSVWKDKDSSGMVEITEVLDGHVRYTWEGERCGWDITSFLLNFEEYTPVIKKLEPKTDMVNHPPHYKDASGIECIEVTQHMRFCEGNSFKYVYRAGSKGNLIEDLKKAAWYAERSWNRSRSGNDRIHWLVQRRGEAVADSRDKQGKTFIAEVMRNIVNNRWWQAYDMLMTEIARLESE